MDTNRIINEKSIGERSKKEITRSYDCAFCKRGFTNAQALGGHMNIHRKDKAKVKKQNDSSVANKSSEYCSPIPSYDQVQLYASLRENKSYQMFDSSANTNHLHGYNHQIVSNLDFLIPYRDFMGSNLSLQIEKPTMEKSKEINIGELGNNYWLGNDQVDLELRLGQNSNKHK